MAVEEHPPAWQTKDVSKIKLVRELEEMGIVFDAEFPEDVKTVKIISVERQRFDKAFVWDIAIPAGLFVAAIACAEFRLPALAIPCLF